MGMSRSAYLVLLALVGAGRLIEMRISARNQRRLALLGVEKIDEPNFPWMVLLHVGILASAGFEVVLLRRPLIPALAVVMSTLFLLANLLRWWVIRSLGAHWNVQVMASAPLGIVSDGPYQWIRHPNYVAVFVELIALPLIHTAWVTAVAGAVAGAWVLSRRLAVEDKILLDDSAYRATMGAKPRFVPRTF
jgi:methyltransferase